MSAPATNALPAPVMMITRTEASSISALTELRKSFKTIWFNAFIGGLSIVIIAIPFSMI
jgi:hypothetical protein